MTQVNDPIFRTKFSEDIFNLKYRHEGAETWKELSRTLAHNVCSGLVPEDIVEEIAQVIGTMEFIPGGRYLYYAGRERSFYNNCYLLRAEDDTRQDWAELSWKAESCLMTGGGIGVDYSVYRPAGAILKGTGGTASGPLPKMEMINEIGRRVMQGGSRRSAIYASLNWKHEDIHEFLKMKDWHHIQIPGTGVSLADVKNRDFNWPAPMDMTNVSVNYDTEWRNGERLNPVFLQNVRQAMMTAEPGFSFNFDHQENETLRNACTEVTSEDDSDVCNLGSLNLARIESKERLGHVTLMATIFLLCGTLRADLPYSRIREVREKNRRLGLGLMGLHEWLLQRDMPYEVTPELKEWLVTYEWVSGYAADLWADKLSISRPVAVRAVAPTGSIGILAGTTTGIEPLFAVAYKRRYLTGRTHWKYQYVIDPIAESVIARTGIDPDEIDTALGLATDFERRVRFQAEVQSYVDMAISSTINLPAWDSELNNEDTVHQYARVIARYAPDLRGLTVYPDGARGGQPLTPVSYGTAKALEGESFDEVVHEAVDVCDITGKGGTCGV